MNYAPIALFAYNRIDHLKNTLHALSLNQLASESILYIFSDGPKNKIDFEKVLEIRSYIKTISGFKEICIIEAESNLGLANSISQGVSKIIKNHGKIIVLEDDILTSPHFLNYMNDALNLYQYDDKVMHISGYMYPINSININDTFFLCPTTCWGWATWDRAWKHFKNDIDYIESKMSKTDIETFNLNNSCNYYEQIKLNKSGKIKTWAIFWYASVFINHGLSLHPKNSMCLNIGNDGSGTNCESSEVYNVGIAQNYTQLKKIEIKLNTEANKQLIKYMRSLNPSLFFRILRKFGIL